MQERSKPIDIIDPRIRPVGSGTVRRLLPVARRRQLGPYVFLDVIGPEVLGPGEATQIGAHPHIGLSTLTYLLDGRIVHRDSTGAVQVIEPGDVNWMTAGSGVTHTERGHPDDLDIELLLRGVQIWIALPDGGEDVDPFFAHVGVQELPVIVDGSATIRLVAGTGWGREAPVPVSSPMILADIAVDGTGVIRLDQSHHERGLLSLEGDLAVDGYGLEPGSLAVLEPGAEGELSGWGRALMIGGEPVGPRTIFWNFVHSDPARIEEAKRAWLAQEFPRVPNDHTDVMEWTTNG